MFNLNVYQGSGEIIFGVPRDDEQLAISVRSENHYIKTISFEV